MIDLTNMESKKGALAALDLILQSRARKLRKVSKDGEDDGYQDLKMPKNIEEVVDDLDSEEQPEETPEEKEKRIEKIKDELTGEKGQQLAQQLRDENQDKKDKIADAKKKEMDDIAKKVAQHGTYAKISDFAADLKRAIARQITVNKHAEDTYTKPNATFAGTKYIMPGQKVLEKRNKPIINVYFDCSGSVPEYGLRLAERALAELNTYKKQGKVDFKVYYFADNVTPDRNEVYGGTGAFGGAIQSHLKQTKATNAIIITDDDFEYQTEFDQISPMKLKGCVWWFWHTGQRSPTAFDYLQGTKGTFQYKL